MIAEYFDTDELCLFGHSKRLAPDDSGTMCSVPVKVSEFSVDCVVTKRGPPLKVNVVDIDARVQNIGKSSIAGALIVVVSSSVASLAGQCCEAPRCVGLGFSLLE